MKRLFCLLTLVAILMGLTTTTALAQEPTYEDVKAKFYGTTIADWEAAGYEKEPFCIDASIIGQPELGGMGFHAANFALLDLEINALEPEILILDADDNVIGVEYMMASQENGQPEIFGQPFEPSEPHPPVLMESHYELHVWFVGDPAVRFVPFNPAVTCPPGSVPSPEQLGLPATGGEGETLPLVSGLLLVLVGGLVILGGLKLRHQLA